MKTIIILLILLFPLTVSADWDRYDTMLLSASTLALIVDWGTTLEIARHPDRYYESNPILGRHPSVGGVNSYFVGCIVGNTVIMYLLPDKWRKVWAGGVLVIEFYAVGRNLNAGVRIRF